MNKYEIDYEYGAAEFYTEATDPAQVRREFHNCANHCFGIRKSIGGYTVVATYLNVDLPIPYRGKDATQFLAHHGDEILFDDRFTEDDIYPWKLHDEGGDWCSCAERGKPELSCTVHHFYVENHDEICEKCKQDKARREAIK